LFLSHQKSLNNQAAVHAAEIKKDLKIKFDEYEKVVQQKTTEANDILKSSAEKLEMVAQIN
jgi:hypothetical protein